MYIYIYIYTWPCARKSYGYIRVSVSDSNITISLELPGLMCILVLILTKSTFVILRARSTIQRYFPGFVALKIISVMACLTLLRCLAQALWPARQLALWPGKHNQLSKLCGLPATYHYQYALLKLCDNAQVLFVCVCFSCVFLCFPS